MDKNRRKDLADIWYTAINSDIRDSYKERNKQYIKEIELIEIFGKLRHQERFSKYLEGDRDERVNKVIDMIEVAVKNYDETKVNRLDKYINLFMESIREIEKRKKEEEECIVYNSKNERDDEER